MIKKQLIKALKVLNKLVPGKKYISFSSLPDFSDNPQALYYTIHQVNPDIKTRFVWHIYDESHKETIRRWLDESFGEIGKNTIIVKKYSFRSVWLFMRSCAIVNSHGLYEFKVSPQKELKLMHGMPLKKVGYILHTDWVPGEKDRSLFSVSAPVFRDIFAKAFNAPEENVYVMGQARNDYLFDPPDGFKGMKDYFLFMPTFRRTDKRYHFNREDCVKKEGMLFNFTREEWKQINDILEADQRTMIVKPHPQDEVDNLEYLKDCKNIMVVDDTMLLENRMPLYRLIGGSIGLITDYSSVYIDYLLTGKPIAFFIPDMSEYAANRGLIFDNFEETLAGVICSNSEEFLTFLHNPVIPDPEKYDRLNRYFNEIRTSDAGKRVLSLLFPNREGR